MKVVSLTGYRDLPRPMALGSLQWINKPSTWRLPAPIAVFGETDANRAQVDEAFRLARNANATGTGIALLYWALVAPNGLVFTREGELIYESVFPWQLENYEAEFSKTLTDLKTSAPDIPFDSDDWTPYAFHAREPGETGYFHFINSILPRIAASDYLDLARQDLPLLFNPYKSFAQETQSALNFPHLAGGKRWTPVHHLYYPLPFTTQGDHFTRSPFGTKLIQDLLTRAFPGQPGKPRRLFLSRRDAAVRQLVDEYDITERLRRNHGFEVVTIENKTLKEQADMFRDVEVLASAHGAGLSNMVFMRPGSLVIEIVSPSRLWPTFRCLAARCGHRYACVIGKELVADPERATGNEDFAVDAAAFNRCVKYTLS